MQSICGSGFFKHFHKKSFSKQSSTTAYYMVLHKVSYEMFNNGSKYAMVAVPAGNKTIAFVCQSFCNPSQHLLVQRVQ